MYVRAICHVTTWKMLCHMTVIVHVLLDKRVEQAVQAAVDAHPPGTQVAQLQLATEGVVVIAKPIQILIVLELMPIIHCRDRNNNLKLHMCT